MKVSRFSELLSKIVDLIEDDEESHELREENKEIKYKLNQLSSQIATLRELTEMEIENLKKKQELMAIGASIIHQEIDSIKNKKWFDPKETPFSFGDSIIVLTNEGIYKVLTSEELIKEGRDKVNSYCKLWSCLNYVNEDNK